MVLTNVSGYIVELEDAIVLCLTDSSHIVGSLRLSLSLYALICLVYPGVGRMLKCQKSDH